METLNQYMNKYPPNEDSFWFRFQNLFCFLSRLFKGVFLWMSMVMVVIIYSVNFNCQVHTPLLPILFLMTAMLSNEPLLFAKLLGGPSLYLHKPSQLFLGSRIC